MVCERETQRDDPPANGLVLNVSEDHRAGPEKFHRRHIVRFSQTIGTHKLHSQHRPAAHVFERKHGHQGGNVVDKLKSDDDIDMRQLNPNVEPPSQLVGGNRGDNLWSLAHELQCDVGILFSNLKTDRQDFGSGLRLFNQSKDQRAFLEILECGCAG